MSLHDSKKDLTNTAAVRYLMPFHYKCIRGIRTRYLGITRHCFSHCALTNLMRLTDENPTKLIQDAINRRYLIQLIVLLFFHIVQSDAS